MMVHIGPDRSSPLLGAVPHGIPKSEIWGINVGHLTANISKTVSRSVTCQLELTSARRQLSKCIAWDGSPMGVRYKENMYFCIMYICIYVNMYLYYVFFAPIAVKSCMLAHYYYYYY